MRISDWSSDVCSSDLQEDPRHFDTSALPLYGTLVKVHHASREAGKLQFVAQGLTRVRIRTWLKHHRPPYLVEVEYPHQPSEPTDEVKEIGRASCRERVCQYV